MKGRARKGSALFCLGLRSKARRNRKPSSGRNRLRLSGAGFRRASEAACGFPSLMGADRLDLPVNSATADLCSILSVENGAGVLRAIVEGWYLDLPYAVFLVGVNYSPLEYPQLGAPLGSCQSRNQEHREGWFDADLIELVKNHLRRGRRRRAIKFEDDFTVARACVFWLSAIC
jgi:hypothetical protein